MQEDYPEFIITGSPFTQAKRIDKVFSILAHKETPSVDTSQVSI